MASKNLNHLRAYPNIYESCEFVLDNMNSSNRMTLVSALQQLGLAFETMVGELVHDAGISDREIMEIQGKQGKGENYATLSGKIMALQNKGIISAADARNFQILNTSRNNAVHPERRDAYANASKGVLSAEVRRIYSLFYQESFLLSGKKRRGDRFSVLRFILVLFILAILAIGAFFIFQQATSMIEENQAITQQIKDQYDQGQKDFEAAKKKVQEMQKEFEEQKKQNEENAAKSKAEFEKAKAEQEKLAQENQRHYEENQAQFEKVKAQIDAAQGK